VKNWGFLLAGSASPCEDRGKQGRKQTKKFREEHFFSSYSWEDAQGRKDSLALRGVPCLPHLAGRTVREGDLKFHRPEWAGRRYRIPSTGLGLGPTVSLGGGKTTGACWAASATIRKAGKCICGCTNRYKHLCLHLSTQRSELSLQPDGRLNQRQPHVRSRCLHALTPKRVPAGSAARLRPG
jgi:hypothetical protein